MTELNKQFKLPPSKRDSNRSRRQSSINSNRSNLSDSIFIRNSNNESYKQQLNFSNVFEYYENLQNREREIRNLNFNNVEEISTESNSNSSFNWIKLFLSVVTITMMIFISFLVLMNSISFTSNNKNEQISYFNNMSYIRLNSNNEFSKKEDASPKINYLSYSMIKDTLLNKFESLFNSDIEDFEKEFNKTSIEDIHDANLTVKVKENLLLTNKKIAHKNKRKLDFLMKEGTYENDLSKNFSSENSFNYKFDNFFINKQEIQKNTIKKIKEDFYKDSLIGHKFKGNWEMPFAKENPLFSNFKKSKGVLKILMTKTSIEDYNVQMFILDGEYMDRWIKVEAICKEIPNVTTKININSSSNLIFNFSNSDQNCFILHSSSNSEIKENKDEEDLIKSKFMGFATKGKIFKNIGTECKFFI